MGKIVRLTESDLVRIIKRVVSEQTLPPKNDYQMIDKKYIGKTFNVYSDLENKQFLFKTDPITSVKREYGGFIFFVGPIFFRFDCNLGYGGFLTNHPFVKKSKGGSRSVLYSNNLYNSVKKDYCTTSQGGKPVPKADFASNNMTNSGTNFA